MNDPEHPDPDSERDANPGEVENDLPVLEVVESFAVAHDCQLLDKNAERGWPGTFATMQCHGCGEIFKLNLLTHDPHLDCPGCDLKYVSILLVGLVEDDGELAAEGIGILLEQNGYLPGQPGAEGDEETEPSELGDAEDDAEREPPHEGQ